MVFMTDEPMKRSFILHVLLKNEAIAHEYAHDAIPMTLLVVINCFRAFSLVYTFSHNLKNQSKHAPRK
jgi:hypothetical protein